MLKNKDSGLMISQSGLVWFPVTVNEEGVSEHFEKEDLFKRVCYFLSSFFNLKGHRSIYQFKLNQYYESQSEFTKNLFII